ncbi:MAG: efflux RND transporter permease subunit, partial [Proteobacteria bacterium]|nr:efflux RND transporter permease subunit [Pseudomonadota bacterium]
NISTSQFKEKLRAQIKDFSYANPVVKDFDPSGGASRGQPFNLFLISNDKVELDKYASLLFEKLKQDPRLKDVDTSNKATRPEFKVKLKEDSARKYGVNSQAVGNELRGYVEGFTPTKLRQNGLEYNIRVRLKPEQRDIKDNFNNIYVPNLNNKLIRLADIAKTEEDIEPATINRQDRGRYIQITASLAPKIGLGNLIADYEKQFKDGELKMPNSVRFSFSGDSENMQDMISSMNKALLLSIVFIYLILTSLYESFVVPFTILLALPLAFCGAFYALYITGESVNIFTMLGIFMLVSVSGKNSILLIDFTNRLIDEGKSRTEALIIAGRVRLRPILMTSIALIVGTLPVAIGFTETASMRTSMGVAIIGGLISSTLLTLVVVPAVFSYIDRFRIWIKAKLWKMVE